MSPKTYSPSSCVLRLRSPIFSLSSSCSATTRYKTMKGYYVARKAGWDTHGLPVELEVEKLLGIDGKPEIEKYGIEPFIKKCKESVWKYKGEWERMSDRVGYWVDMDNPYITYDDNYIESVWWAVKTIADKGLIYKGSRQDMTDMRLAVGCRRTVVKGKRLFALVLFHALFKYLSLLPKFYNFFLSCAEVH